jgi:hypothetical protein
MKPAPVKRPVVLLPVCGTCWSEIRPCSPQCSHGGWVHRDTELHRCGRDRFPEPGSVSVLYLRWARPATAGELAPFRQQRDEPAAAAV